jgi:hypothetical protein
LSTRKQYSKRVSHIRLTLPFFFCLSGELIR